MPRAGKYKHRVKIQTPVRTRNDHGGFSESGVTESTVWCQIKPVSSKEFFESATVEATVTHQIKMRYRTDITKQSNLIYRDKARNDRQFNVKHIFDSFEEGRELFLMCEEVI